MKIVNKNITVLLLMICVILFTIPATSFAAEDDVLLPITFNSGVNTVWLGTAIQRGEDLWIPESAMKSMGVVLIDAQNNRKGFYIKVANPAEVFGIADLTSLAGQSLSLYFASIFEQETSYFNVVGMEALTGLSFEKNDTGVVFHKYKSSLSNLLQKRASKPPNKNKISLAWAHITRDNPNLAVEQTLDGLSILSPTWFNLMDGSGLMANRASVSYVEAAHNKKYQVWALVSNGFSKSNTTLLFKNERAINLFIARILAYAKLYNLDGINFDFENVDVNDREAYVRFMAKVAPLLKAQGLKVSVDVHIPSPNSSLSKSHDRGSLSKYVDYVMLMAYDEHWRTCSRAGSVASQPWVERAVLNTLAEGVPKEKLVLGVPFYMRKWEETVIKGKTKVRGMTLTMQESNDLIASKNIVPKWSEQSGQLYYSYVENGKTYKVWVENADSIKMKISLIKKYGLAGVAGWRKGHETADIWKIFEAELER